MRGICYCKILNGIENCIAFKTFYTLAARSILDERDFTMPKSWKPTLQWSPSQVKDQYLSR